MSESHRTVADAAEQLYRKGYYDGLRRAAEIARHHGCGDPKCHACVGNCVAQDIESAIQESAGK